MGAALDWLRHLLSAEYLYAQEPAPLGRLGAAQAIWALALALLALGAAAAARRGRRGRWAAAAAFAGGGALLVIARPWVAGVLTARVWALSATGLALGFGALAAAPAGLRRPRPARPVAGAVAAAGAALLAVPAGEGWAAGVGIAALAVASLAAGPRRVRLDVLAPLAAAGFAAAGGWALERWLGVDLAAYRGVPFPDPVSPWATPRVVAIAGAAGSVLLAARAAFPGRVGAFAGVALAAAGAGAFLATAARHLPAGVTASDPFCYLQMAADLAERGTALHPYPLAELVRGAGLPVWPAAHVGYHPPAGDWAATVWPIGWPVLLAPLYALGGEAAAMWGAPLWLLAAAGGAGLLAAECAGSSEGHERLLAGGLAAFVVLTSAEAVLRALLPLADAASMALAALALLALSRAARARATGPALAWAAGAGLALGLDYWVRHPQLPLALAGLGLLAAPARGWRLRWGTLAVCAAGALVAALPDLAYHARAFGSAFIAESPEGYLLAAAYVPRTAGPMLGEILGRREFGYLAPLVGCGFWRMWRAREDRPLALATTLGLAGVLGFNLSYAAVRLRDLLPLFPILAAWAAWGAADLVRGAVGRGAFRAAAGVGLVALAFAARSAWALGLPADGDIPAFGRLAAGEVAALRAFGEALPEDAVVLASLHSGAVERYAGRPALRPAAWSDAELARALAALEAAGRPAVLLVDGEETRDDLHPRLVALAPLTPRGSLPIPLLGRDGSQVGRGVAVYAAGPNAEGQDSRD